jgi:2,3-dihydroxybenzoate decarboxylase
MLQKPACQVVALEEHYWDRELVATYPKAEQFGPPELHARLYDLGDQRIKEMDEAGVDYQIISHGAPSTQNLAGTEGVALARRVNDRLAAACRAHPTRLGGFAALPTADPNAAADELARSVEQLGFKGAMVSVMANGEFLDHQRYWPIFARAEALDVPIYLHPASPHASVTDIYYRDYLKDYPMLTRAAWGYAVETGTQAVRLVLSGLFDKHPRLKLILGHLGETMPFWLWRIDSALARPGQKSVRFREIFSRHFWITTSGFFSTPALQCCMMELGIDRILFSIDWPFVMNPPGVRWLEGVPISDEDKIKLASGNAKRLMRV